MTSVMWFRRDLRLGDHPALGAAAAAGPVVGLFVLDDALLGPSGPNRAAYVLASVRALQHDLAAHGGHLVVRTGDPADVVPSVAAEVEAAAVHVSEDFGPYGRGRDETVADALGEVQLVRTGSPYTVSPGRVTTGAGDTFKVFTAFYRAWSARGWRAPAPTDPDAIDWVAGLRGERLPAAPRTDAELPAAGEAAALEAWRAFRRGRSGGYAEQRNRPDLDATSRLSPFLKVGAIHPRTILAALDADDEVFRKELAWREFYAAVLARWPASARNDFDARLAGMRHDRGAVADRRFEAWTAGRTGFPIVDAGMRQLLGEGWMHNRVRMITASFLTKDLHLPWWRGARHFMHLLVDGDLASNQHGWQWTAGTGTDAAPYFRIFNPVAQGKRFDPDGDYVRRWVPELRELTGARAHEPWDEPSLPSGYPPRIVDHAAERAESLDRYTDATRRVSSS